MKTSDALTFSDLDRLMDGWIVDTMEMEKVFVNQSLDIKNFFFVVGKNNERLKNVNNWLNVLRFYDKVFEEDVKIITRRNLQLERVVEQVEASVPKMKDLEVVDPARVHLYQELDFVFNSINYLYSEIEESNKRWTTWDEDQMKDPAEKLAKIMMVHLELLQNIEFKTFRAISVVQAIECFKRLLTGRAHDKLINISRGKQISNCLCRRVRFN